MNHSKILAEFDEKFNWGMSSFTNSMQRSENPRTSVRPMSEIRNFLLSAIQRIRDEERGIVREEIKSVKEMYEPAYGDENRAYVQACEDLLTSLSNRWEKTN